jgi:ectoine hydroxylase-related dioxygenase (phytanoyl-CoA dioxygenase family)
MPVLTATLKEQFEEEGYVVVEDILDSERDIAPLMAEYDAVLDDLARSLHAEGRIASPHAGLPFDQRLIEFAVESGRTHSLHFDISLPQKGVRHDTPMHLGPAVFNLLASPRLLDNVEQLIGPEIYSNPVQHIRMKLPHRAIAPGQEDGLVSQSVWHQDNGVILPEADETDLLTVWMAITDATLENGCLQVVPRSHRDGLITHCPGGLGLHIPEKLFMAEQARPLPMRKGSVLFMHRRTVHGSLDNSTDDQVRLSFDLRYHPIGQPTGRPAFPGFVARSAAHPETMLRDPNAWAQSWREARARLAEQEDPTYNRWADGSPVCA